MSQNHQEHGNHGSSNHGSSDHGSSNHGGGWDQGSHGDKHGGYDSALTATKHGGDKHGGYEHGSKEHHGDHDHGHGDKYGSNDCHDHGHNHNHDHRPSPRRLPWRPWRRLRRRRLRRRLRALRRLGQPWRRRLRRVLGPLLISLGPAGPLLPAVFPSQRPRSLRGLFLFKEAADQSSLKLLVLPIPIVLQALQSPAPALSLIAYSPDFSLSFDPVTYGTAATPCS